MTAKRFTFHHDVDGVDYINDGSNGFCLICDELMCSLLNEQHETIERLKQNIDELMCVNVEEDLLKENEQLYYEIQKIAESNECLLTQKRRWEEMSDEYAKLYEKNEQLKNRVDELEDDNMKYTLSTDKLEGYTKRFMPTKCINEFRDCKTNRYYWLDNEDNFTGALELLNLLDCENEQLRNRLKDWHQRTFKAHNYFNLLEKVIDEVCDDDISNKIWKEYEKREKLIE